MITEKKTLFAMFITLALASACDKEQEEGDDGASDGLEIAGSWVDNYMQMHEISDARWATTSMDFSFAYTIDHFDNEAEFLVGQDEGDMTWGKFEWTNDAEGSLWYCQTAFGESTPAAAEAAAAADRTDPAVGGCGGMFPWSRLDPA
jgi:hypothetical protein